VIKIKGNTPEEKLQHVEKILNRMSRKLHKTVVGVMPPIPIIFSTDAPKEDGEIFTFLAPASGRITDICLMVGEYKDQTPVEFKASVEGQVHGSSGSFRTRKNLTITALDLDVHPGDLLRLTTTAEPGQINRIWLSFLYQLGIDKVAKANYIADELFKLLEEENLDGEA